MANLSYNYTNGGINNESNPDKFEGKEIVLENPQRRGYEFEGWYQESTYNNKVVSIPENTNADQTIYAKWKKFYWKYLRM